MDGYSSRQPRQRKNVAVSRQRFRVETLRRSSFHSCNTGRWKMPRQSHPLLHIEHFGKPLNLRSAFIERFNPHNPHSGDPWRKPAFLDRCWHRRLAVSTLGVHFLAAPWGTCGVKSSRLKGAGERCVSTRRHHRDKSAMAPSFE